MNKRGRGVLFIILAVMLVFLAEKITALSNQPHRQSQAKSEPENPQRLMKRRSADAPKATVHQIPLYLEGDLLLSYGSKIQKTPPRKKPKKERKKPPQPEKPLAHSSSAKKLQPKSPESQGNRPILEVSYTDIGFDRYLNVIERIGRLFILINSPSGPTLGPEISLRHSRIYENRSDLSDLATNRPHQVSDAKIRERLANIKLPPDAVTGSVVLVMNQPFDSLLWDTINDTLANEGLKIEQIGKITGNYTEETGRISLDLEIAILKGSKKVMYLDQTLMVALMD